MGRRRQSGSKRKTPVPQRPAALNSGLSSLQKAILEALAQHPEQSFDRRELFKTLGLRRRDYGEFRRALHQLLALHSIDRLDKKSISLPRQPNYASGHLRLTSHGYGFIDHSNGASIFINPREAAEAFEGDHIRVELRDRGHAAGPEGHIVSIDSDQRLPLLGVLFQREGRWHAEVKTGPLDFIARLEGLRYPEKLQPGDWVILKAPASRKRYPLPHCTIIKHLGSPREPKVAEKGLLTSFGFSEAYPKKAISEALKLRVEPAHKGLRRDLTDETVITIDPATAKDHDDAVSLSRGNKGDYILNVHIADVSRYVRPDSLIDQEARQRGFSVYLQHHHLPMLPPRLPGEICSLRPGRDRLALTVRLHINSHGQILQQEVFPSRIKVRYMISYETAQRHLDAAKGASDTVGLDTELVSQLGQMWELASRLRQKRIKEGGVDFDLPEPGYLWDDQAAPVSIFREPRLESHRLVEEFMLAANRAVAELWIEQFGPEVANIYRVHPPMEAERRQRLADYLSEAGFEWAPNELTTAAQIGELMEESHRRFPPEITAVIARKAMTLARYDIQPTGHFGLGFKRYLHFTSPIRRYADLMVHRLLWEHLIYGKPIKNKEVHNQQLETLSQHLTSRERIISELEREASKVAGLLYLDQHRGQIFSARLVDTYQENLYLSLENLFLEGTLTSDSPIRFKAARPPKKTQRYSRRDQTPGISLGDALDVRIKRLDLLHRKLELASV